MSNVGTTAFSELAEVNPRLSLQTYGDDMLVSFIPMSDVSEGGKWTVHQERRLGDVRFGYTAFLESDLLFAKITPCMENGKGAHAVGLKNGIGCGSTEFHVLRAKGETSARYLHHWLQARTTRAKAISYMGGSAGQQRVQPQFFDRYRVPKLNPAEQRQAAAVLDQADEAIAKTEAVIAKLRQVRTGLIHDLLTCGLDENGHLRDPFAHPEQFQETVMGLRPRDWEIAPIGTKCETYAGGTPPRGSPEFFGGNVPWIKSGEVNQDAISTTEETLSERGLAVSSAKWIAPENPLMAMYGATAGQVSWLTTRATANQAVLAIIPRSDDTVARFLFWMLRFVAPQIITLATGSGQPNLSKGLIDRALVVIPRSPDEQRSIAARIDTAVAIEKPEAANLEKLIQLKSGLMDDLLTGRVRVPATTI